MKRLLAAAFVLLSSLGCGELATSSGASSGPREADSPAQETKDNAAERAAESPPEEPVRNEYCVEAFSTTVASCARYGNTSIPELEDPAQALPADFPIAPQSLTYCDGGRDEVGTTGVRWTMAGPPDEMQEYYVAALATQGYERTLVERAPFAPCAEAISFWKEGVGSGFLGFSVYLDPTGVDASATVVSVTFAPFQ